MGIFDEEFRSVLQDERFHKLPQDQQQKYIQSLINDDEELAKLAPDQQQKYVSSVIGDVNKEFEDNQFRMQAAGKVIQAGQTPDEESGWLGAKSLADIGASFGQAGMESVGNLLQSTAQRGSEVTDALRSKLNQDETPLTDEQLAAIPPSGLPGEVMTAQPDGTPEKFFSDTLNAVIEKMPQGLRDSLDNDLESIDTALRGFGKSGDKFKEWAANTWRRKDPATLEKLMKSKGVMDGFGNLVSLAGTVSGQSFGMMVPAMLATEAAGPKAGLAMMQSVYAGSQMETAKELGVELTPAEREVSAAVQAGLDVLAGPESVGVLHKTGSDVIEYLLKSGFKRGAARVAAGTGMESVTEFLQEYVNQQVPRWHKGDRQLWENLSDDAKSNIIQGAVLAPLAAGPIEVIGATKQGLGEKATGRVLKAIEERRKAYEEMTPEERGAKGFVTEPKRFEQMSIEERLNELAPEWMAEEDRTPFSEGKPIDESKYTPEQRDELRAAREAALQPQENPEALPTLENPDEEAVADVQTIVDQLNDEADAVEESGDAELAAKIRDAAKTIRLVDPKENESLREMQGFAARFGRKVYFFDSADPDLVGVNGMTSTPNSMLVYHNTAAPAFIARSVIHEMTHTAGMVNREAQRGLYDILEKFDPEVFKEVQDQIKEVYSSRGIDLTEGTLVSETVAHVSERFTPSIFRAIQAASTQAEEQWDKQPSQVRKFLNRVWDIYKKANGNSKLLRAMFGDVKEGNFDPSRNTEIKAVTTKILQYLQENQGDETGQVSEVAAPAEEQAAEAPAEQPAPQSMNIGLDTFGRQGRKKLDIHEAPPPEPRTPRIVEQGPTITEDTGKKAGKRKRLNINEVAPPEAREPRILEAEPEAEEEITIKTEKPIGKPKPREPRITEILPETQGDLSTVTAARLEVGDVVQDEFGTKRLVTNIEVTKGGRRSIQFNDEDAVHVGANKRFLKFTPEQEAKALEAKKEKLKKGVEKLAKGEEFSFREPSLIKEKLDEELKDPLEAGLRSWKSDPGLVRRGARMLLNGEQPRVGDSITTYETLRMARAVLAAVDSSEEYQGTLWRGEKRQRVPEVGEVLASPLLGVTKNRSTAVKFSGKHGQGTKVLYKIVDNPRALEVGAQNAASESEMIVRGDGFMVDSVSKKDGVAEIALKKVTPQQWTEQNEAETEKIRNDPDFSLVFHTAGEEPDTKTGQHTEMLAEIKNQMGEWQIAYPFSDSLLIYDDDVPVGFALPRERFLDSEKDREVYFDYIVNIYDKNGRMLKQDEQGMSQGIKNILAAKEQLRERYPKAIWAGGERIAGAHMQGMLDTGADNVLTDLDDVGLYTRIPLWTAAERKKGLAPEWYTDDKVAEGRVPHSVLIKRYGVERAYGEVPEYENPKDAPKSAEQLRAVLDEKIKADAEAAIDVIRDNQSYLQTENDELYADLVDAVDRAFRDPDYSFMLGKPVSEYTTEDWVKLGKEHGIEGLGGMGELEEVAPGIKVPGGLDGKFTYEELLWMKAQAYDTSVMDEATHKAIHEKIIRTLQPEKVDSMQVLNNFMFAMLSPNQPLTPNELAYAVVRVRNNAESQAFAKMIPWDVTNGEQADWDTYLKYDKDNPNVEEFIKRAWLNMDKNKGKKVAPRLEDMLSKDFNQHYRNYYNSKLSDHFGLQARTAGGMGLKGTSELIDLAALNQWYQKDPDWFPMQDMDKGSWDAYVERLSTQFRGMATKVASFAAVWQDPMYAAISAIDRHMARIFQKEMFPTNKERYLWEMDTVEKWNKSKYAKTEGKITPKRGTVEKARGVVKNFDELFTKEHGDKFFMEQMYARLQDRKAVLFYKKTGLRNKALPKHWKEFEGNFLRLGDDRQISLMSDAYRAALQQNAKEAERLGMGTFASQWFLWDRHRRRLETHEVMFPGLYKLPHLSRGEIVNARDNHSTYGYLSSIKDVDTVKYRDLEGEMRSETGVYLRQVRTAPLGALSFFSFDMGPTHFPPGHGLSTPMYNAVQTEPLSGVNPNSGPLFALPEEYLWSYLRRKVQDKFFRVKQLQKAIEMSHGNIGDQMDAYMHEMLYYGRAANQIERFEQDHVKPLMEFIAKNNIDIDEFEQWLHARHARERNAHLRAGWKERTIERLTSEIDELDNEIAYADDQNIDSTIMRRRRYRKKRELDAARNREVPNSGMTDEQADEILAAAGNKFNAVARKFDALMARKLEIMKDGGLVTDAEIERVMKYEHYVPLKGRELPGDLEEILDNAGLMVGQGFDIRGDDLGFSFGRTEGQQHTRPIISQAVVDIEQAIIRAEKNRVGQAFLELVKQYPNEALYKVNASHNRRVWDKATGEIRLVKDAFANRKNNVLGVKVDGKVHYIEIYDARLASAMKNLGSEPMSNAIKVLAGVNRMMAQLNTTLNPEFMLANFMRDVQAAGINLSAENLKAMRGEALTGIPVAANAIRKAEGWTADENAEGDPIVQLYRQFEEDGGKMGFFGFNDVAAKARQLERYMKHQRQGPRPATYRFFKKAIDIVETGNGVIENATRFSVYMAALKNGQSRQRAAEIARNITVNFNKKGEAGTLINALWLFSNASIQGTTRMFSAVVTSPSVRRLVGAQVMASFAMAKLARNSGDDDEDGFSYWEKIGDWEKERNLIIMINGKGDYIKVPLPYGYNIFHVLGTEMERLHHLVTTGQMTKGEAGRSAINFFNAIMGAFNPLGGASLDSKWTSLRFMVPSAFAPIADTFVNETYYGAPIAPTRSSWDKSPDSTRYFKSVSGASRELTAMLNRWTGGSEYESGWLDLNPENLDYLTKSYAGAGAQTLARGLGDTKWIWDSVNSGKLEKKDVNDIVFLRRVYGEQNEWTASAMFYENIDDLKQGEKAYKNLKGEALKEWKRRKGWMIPLFKKLKEAEKGIRDTDDPDAKDRIRKRFNKFYREAWMKQF